MPKFDLDAARKAGYSDDEIIGYLNESRGFDVGAAREAGYSTEEIIQHLSSKPKLAGDVTESPPGRFISGLGRSAKATVEGIRGLPAFARKATSQPIYRTASDIVSGFKQFPATVAQEFKEDPWEASGKLTGDVAQIAAGFGTGRAGSAIGRAGRVRPAPGPIPGAAPFASEASTGGAGMMARMVERSPIGAKPVAKALGTRQAAIKAEAGRLMGGPPVTSMESVGAKSVDAIKAANQAAKVRETGLWNALKDATDNLGIGVELEQTALRTEPLLLEAKEAHDVIKSALSPSTQSVLMKINKQKQLRDAAEAGAALGTNMGMSTAELLQRMPPAAREQILATLGGAEEVALPSWKAVHQARSEIGQMLRSAKNRDALGSHNTGVLNQVYGGLTEDLQTALSANPELSQLFDQASMATRTRRATYGTKGTLVEKYMKAEPSIMPSEAVTKLMRGTPESARNFSKAMGSDIGAREAVSRGIMTEIFQKATKGKFGEAGAIMDGPMFEKVYRANRDVIAELVEPSLLRAWDDFAAEVGKYQLTGGGAGTKAGIAGRIASLFEAGAIVGAASSVVTGHPLIALGTMTPIMAGRQLVNIMLQPAGPNLLARYLQTGKWTPALGHAIKTATYMNMMTRSEAVKAAQEERERLDKGEEP